MEERMKLITWKRTMPSLISIRRLRERMSWAVVVREKTSQRPVPLRNDLIYGPCNPGLQ